MTAPAHIKPIRLTHEVITTERVPVPLVGDLDLLAHLRDYHGMSIAAGHKDRALALHQWHHFASAIGRLVMPRPHFHSAALSAVLEQYAAADEERRLAEMRTRAGLA